MGPFVRIGTVEPGQVLTAVRNLLADGMNPIKRVEKEERFTGKRMRGCGEQDASILGFAHPVNSKGSAGDVAEKRILLDDDQRCRLAVKGKVLGRKALRDITTIVTPDTILRWHRNWWPTIGITMIVETRVMEGSQCLKKSGSLCCRWRKKIPPGSTTILKERWPISEMRSRIRRSATS